ncbi:hypothetical protein [Terracoccus luteus]|uniref:Uncharacterized protein n=1 Tax=Terracoccus luteus TaxID=53356 RepID=A0A839Q0M3_9MICO|nr:hypothetical protein [Terracoccus luteus]MBB2988514.1 hypothetical protein [Terracoccus luteus]MCP2174164.1 hypothetical protein [Terracoccus luteus]
MTWDTPQKRAEGLVEMFLGERLRDSSEPPGIRDAVVNVLLDRVEDIQKRSVEQISQLRSPSSRRIPDAYFNDEEEPENALQTVGAGIRTAFALAGQMATNARAQEVRYARYLAPSAYWATLGEASRVPRPGSRHQVLGWSCTPIPWHEENGAWPPDGAVDLEGTRQLLGAYREPVRITEKPYEGWVQLALFERQGTLATTYPETPARTILVATGLEVTDGPVPEASLPFIEYPPQIWTATHNRLVPELDEEMAAVSWGSLQGPLAAIVTYAGQLGAPRPERGAGLHWHALTPRLEIAALLDLRPEEPAIRHALVDDHGLALVGRVWRGFLVHDGNYTPLEPSVEGTDLIIRPDLYDQLEAAIGTERIRSGITVRHYEVNAHASDAVNDS